MVITRAEAEGEVKAELARMKMEIEAESFRKQEQRVLLFSSDVAITQWKVKGPLLKEEAYIRRTDKGVELVVRGEGEYTVWLEFVTRVTKERLGQLYAVNGKNREKLPKVVAGDIAASVKLKDSPTNSSLTTPKNSDDALPPIEFPEPKFRVAVKAVNQGDEEKMSGILTAMHKVDQTLVVQYSKELKQLILGGQGELHLNITKWQIENLEHIPTGC